MSVDVVVAVFLVVFQVGAPVKHVVTAGAGMGPVVGCEISHGSALSNTVTNHVEVGASHFAMGLDSFHVCPGRA